MNPFTSGALFALFLLLLLYVCLRPLEHFDSNLRLPVAIFCLLQTISLVARDNDMVLWGATFLQLIVTGIIARGFFAHRQRHRGNDDLVAATKNETPSTLWIKAHMHYLKRPQFLLIIGFHILDAVLLWNPRSPYTKNDYEIFGTIYNLIHLIMFITLAWRKRKPGTPSRAFYVYNFIVGLQPTRAIVRTVTACPFRPDTIYWRILLYFLSSALATVDTLPALNLCFQGVSSEAELSSSLLRVIAEEQQDIGGHDKI
ncbi:hypothetical protein BDB00DRAFT_845223 [Zychaea mexicana]|uniref:uncharacterized protein n=1 Tax=Zychaea mexicana TaxID=64656 RepID=UPI0022FDB284|nr:uncharacterized protein BDB00DRAFT_845223 [Zychaea mexicana]KAI9489115.1 hypothetical protein BDB00DRAFT_845223 [Zychaea mexicana]